MSSTETCGELKNRIANDLSVAASRLVLTHQGKPCHDGTRVNTYISGNNVPIHANVAKFVDIK